MSDTYQPRHLTRPALDIDMYNYLARAYLHMKEAASLCYMAEIYDAEHECREAIIYLADLAKSLGVLLSPEMGPGPGPG
jgi:hypothetical protein